METSKTDEYVAEFICEALKKECEKYNYDDSHAGLKLEGHAKFVQQILPGGELGSYLFAITAGIMESAYPTAYARGFEIGRHVATILKEE